jgi:hypothetical protein
MSSFTEFLMWVAAVVGVILVIMVAIVLFGFKDWMDRGSH